MPSNNGMKIIYYNALYFITHYQTGKITHLKVFAVFSSLIFLFYLLQSVAMAYFKYDKLIGYYNS